MHHIVSDGWSMGVLMRELAALYAAFAAGRPSPLPALPVQYADYAVWQRSGCAASVLEASSPTGGSSWRGLPPVLELPTDRPRPAVAELPRRAAAASAARRAWPAALAGARPARGRHALHDAAGGVPGSCSRATAGRTTWSSGSPIAGRTRTETEGLIGFFVNTLVLRTDCPAIRPSASCCSGCARWRWTPTPTRTCPSRSWSRTAAAARPEPDAALPGHVLALLNAPPASLAMPGLTTELVDTDAGAPGST